jgi:hypothetical protein
MEGALFVAFLCLQYRILATFGAPTLRPSATSSKGINIMSLVSYLRSENFMKISDKFNDREFPNLKKKIL